MSLNSNRPRCLILGCSRTKNESSKPLTAIQRYDGPPFKVLRRFLQDAPTYHSSLDIYVLSARYGMIDGQALIPAYDQIMTTTRALEIRSSVTEKIKTDLHPENYSEIFLSMGKTYLQAIADLELVTNGHTKIIVASGSAGSKLTELRNWLWGEKISPSRPGEIAVVSPQTVPQTVVLRGSVVTLTTDQALAQLQIGLIQEPDAASKTRNWYVDIATQKISPKWAARYLFSVPVSQFSADEARRVLRKLGLNCYQQ